METVTISKEEYEKLKSLGKKELVTISKKEYEELLEEVEILNNEEMMAAIKESDEAKKKGVKTWELRGGKDGNK